MKTAHDPILRGCSHCGLVHRLNPVPIGYVARCVRCNGVIARAGGLDRNRLSAAVALAALICYPLGITLPVMRLEQLGLQNEASVWSGALELIGHGDLLIGGIVLVCSVIIPALKLVGLIGLSFRPDFLNDRHRALVYRAIEIAGRWGMIDVLLVAMLVAALKLGDLVEVHPGPGVAAFTACVGLSLVASSLFNPHALWERSA